MGTIATILALLTAAFVNAPGAARHPHSAGPVRAADKTGHVSNYDEAKVGTFALPDPLTLTSGKPVRDAATWSKQRRAEAIRLYENDIFGRIPVNTPNVAWTVAGLDNISGVTTTR